MSKILFLEGPIQTGKSTLIREVLGSHLQECGGFASQRLVDASGQTRGFRIGPASTTDLTAPLVGLRPGPVPSHATDLTAPPSNMRPGPAPANATDPKLPAASALTIETPPAGADPFAAATRGPAPGPAQTMVPPLPEFLLTDPNGGVYSGVFKYFDRMDRVHTDQEIFDVLGTFYLTTAIGRPLALLDEIGGSELLSDPFRAALEQLLDSGTPCLGVFKLEKNARRMQRAYGFDPDRPVTSGRPSIVDRSRDLRRKILEEYGGEILYYDRDSDDAPAVRKALRQFVESIF